MAGLADKVGENYDYEHVIGLDFEISFATNYQPAWPIYFLSIRYCDIIFKPNR